MIKRGPHIHTNGLTYYIDAANPKSYISGSSTTFNMLDTTQTGSFTNDIGATVLFAASAPLIYI